MSDRDRYWDDTGCARALAAVLEADVGVPLADSERTLYRACLEEARLPDPDEVWELVTGGEDGEVDPALAARFPRIHAALDGLL